MDVESFDLMFYEHRFTDGTDRAVSYSCHAGAIYAAEGSICIDGSELNQGEGRFVSGFFSAQPTAPGPVTLLYWGVVASGESEEKRASLPRSVACERVDRLHLASNEIVIRLDTVTFPPGSCAYRHVHAGPGTRYLLSGSLEINGEQSREFMQPRDAWFEAENSAVLAIADKMVETVFVRMLVLTPDYLGKPTITYLDPADNEKPRRQVNQRLIDQLVRIDI